MELKLLPASVVVPESPMHVAWRQFPPAGKAVSILIPGGVLSAAFYFCISEFFSVRGVQNMLTSRIFLGGAYLVILFVVWGCAWMFAYKWRWYIFSVTAVLALLAGLALDRAFPMPTISTNPTPERVPPQTGCAVHNKQFVNCTDADLIKWGQPLLDRLRTALEKVDQASRARHARYLQDHNEQALHDRLEENIIINRCLENDYNNLKLYRAEVISRLPGGNPSNIDPLKLLELHGIGPDGIPDLMDKDSNFTAAQLILRDLGALTDQLQSTSSGTTDQPQHTPPPPKQSPTYSQDCQDSACAQGPNAKAIYNASKPAPKVVMQGTSQVGPVPEEERLMHRRSLAQLSNPGLELSFYVESYFQSPMFRVTCDRPCAPDTIFLTENGGALTMTNPHFLATDNPKVVLLGNGKPIDPKQKVIITVRSQDEVPLKSAKVEGYVQ